MAQQMTKQGWFSTKGRLGDRTLKQQLMGLDPLFAECKGKTVLDVGCAEGLISIELAKAGAASVHGVEIVPGHVEVGKKLKGNLPVKFAVGDANTWTPRAEYDIVIALALLHKLSDPSAACARFAAHCNDLMVLRLPPLHAPTIIDERSGGVPHDIGKVMLACGFVLEREARDGPFEEWLGFYRRARA